MIPQEEAVIARLNDLSISFTRHEHPPVATAEEADQHWAGIEGTHCKNLFLRNQIGRAHV
jgi:Ala-tRNA(Pro) deacylase